MPVNINIKPTGFSQVDEVLKGLPEQLRRRVLISAARTAAKPLVRDMRKGFDRVSNSASGETRKALGVRALRSSKKSNAAVFVGAREGKRYKGYVARFLEAGTKLRTPRKKSVRFLKFTAADGSTVFARSVAPVEARPFIGPAIDQNAEGIKRSMADSIATALNRYMKRTIKRHMK